jgi:predicted ester cyclase
LSSPLNPSAVLARRFCVDWLDRADASVPPAIMTPGYRVHIGRDELDGLDAYTTGTMGQLTQFAGLLLTVHQLVSDGDQLALHFTEHGASTRHGGNTAAWRGVALFRVEDGRLAENWTQEDYYARRRQLADGQADPVPAPAVSPWTTPVRAPAPAAEKIARRWLGEPAFDTVVVDDGSAPVIEPTSFHVDRLFSAGDVVAFAGAWHGQYIGGLEDVTTPADGVQLGACGVLTVGDSAGLAGAGLAGTVSSGAVVTDRLGLRRALRPR